MADRENYDLTRLSGTNYTLWKFDVTIVLEAKGIIGHIQGTEAEPDKTKEPAVWKTWSKDEAQAKVTILSSVDRSIRQYLVNCVTAKDIWEKLKDLYGEAGIHESQGVLQEYLNFSMPPGEPVALQLENFRTLLRKLEELNEKPKDDWIKAKLVSILPERFSVIRASWEGSSKEERTYDNLIKRVIQEERRIKEREEREAGTLALQVQAMHLQKPATKNPKGKSKAERRKEIEEKKKRTKCAKCKKIGHWVRECPEKSDGRPPEDNDRKHSKENANISIVNGYFCDVTVDDELEVATPEFGDLSSWGAKTSADVTTLETLRYIYSE